MTVIEPETTTHTFSVVPLRTQVRSALQHYFLHLEGDMPVNLYKLVIQEVECPLLETVMDQARGNQTKAAEMLGINRSTLRKKLKQYGIDQ